VLVVAITLIGTLLRAAQVLSADFPLNDGGLFVAMMRDVQASGFRLPEVTTYNTADIPFAYPPLAIFVGAFVDRFTPLSAIDVIRLMPLCVSIATIPAFYWLATTLLSDRHQQFAATFLFSLMPKASTWMVMGGSLTRSFGLLFAIMTLVQLRSMYKHPSKRSVALASFFGGLTLMSHPEVSWLLFISSVVFIAAFSPTRKAILLSVAVVAGTFAVASPWLIAIITNHGMQPVLHAGGSRSIFDAAPLLQVITLNVTNETLFPLLSVVSLIGVVFALFKRSYFLVIWLAVAALAESWVMTTAILLPLALLGGIGFSEVIVPLFRKCAPASLSTRALALTGAGAVTAYCGIAALAVPVGASQALPPAEREALAWLSRNTPSSSGVLVISGEPWWRDRTSEWLPALAGRRSIATPQGLEWMPGGAFEAAVDAHGEAQHCANESSACLAQWARSAGRSFSVLFVSKTVPTQLQRGGFNDCCAALRASVKNDHAYDLLYDGPGATILGRRTESPQK
jgi:hypothetical protein